MMCSCTHTHTGHTLQFSMYTSHADKLFTFVIQDGEFGPMKKKLINGRSGFLLRFRLQKSHQQLHLWLKQYTTFQIKLLETDSHGHPTQNHPTLEQNRVHTKVPGSHCKVMEGTTKHWPHRKVLSLQPVIISATDSIPVV